MQIVLGAFPAQASPETDAYKKAVEQMRKTRDYMDKNFYTLVHTSTRNGIMTQYSYTLWDHLAARDILRTKAESGLARLSRIRQEFSEYRSKLFAPDSNWDENASMALARAAHAQSAAIEAAQIVRDAADLAESWRTQCNAQKTERVAAVADPLTYWTIKDENVPAAPKPNIEIGVRVTTDTDGNVQSAQAGDENGNPANWEDSLLYGAYYFWEVPVYGWIVSIVCIAVWACIKLGRLTHDVGVLGGLKGELYDMQRQIRDIQIGALARVSQETPGMVADACKTMFPAENEKYLNIEVFGKYQEQAQADLKDITAQSQDIIQAFQDRYQNLVQIYLPSVKETYASLIDVRLAQSVKMEKQVKMVITNVFQPMFSSFEEVKSAEGFGKWASLYEIWGATITTDALFRSEPGFSLVNVPGTAAKDSVSKFGNSWNNIGPKMKGIFK
jgi:hypothetical protein